MNWSRCGDVSLHLDVGDYTFYFITVFNFCILLFCMQYHWNCWLWTLNLFSTLRHYNDLKIVGILLGFTENFLRYFLIITIEIELKNFSTYLLTRVSFLLDWI